jgi:integrase
MTKTKKERIIPLCKTLCHTLEQLCSESSDDLVFAYVDRISQSRKPYTSFKNSWNGIRTRADLKDVRFHDLRHMFASWWVQHGGSLLHLRDILGHSSMIMVQRYAHLNTAAHHDEIGRVFKHSLDTEENNSEHSDQ